MIVDDKPIIEQMREIDELIKKVTSATAIKHRSIWQPILHDEYIQFSFIRFPRTAMSDEPYIRFRKLDNGWRTEVSDNDDQTFQESAKVVIDVAAKHGMIARDLRFLVK